MLTLVLIVIFIAMVHGYRMLAKIDKLFSDRLIRPMVYCTIATAIALFGDTMSTANITSRSMQSGLRMIACGVAMAAVSRALFAIMLFANHRRETGNYTILSSTDDTKEDELCGCRS